MRYLQSFFLVVAFALVSCRIADRPPSIASSDTLQLTEGEFLDDVDSCRFGWKVVTTHGVYIVDSLDHQKEMCKKIDNLVTTVLGGRGDTLFASTRRQGFLKSVNGGRTFFSVPLLDEIGNLSKLVFYGSDLLAITADGRLFQSRQGVQEWKKFEVYNEERVADVFSLHNGIVSVGVLGTITRYDSNGLIQGVASIRPVNPESFSAVSRDSLAYILNDSVIYRLRDANGEFVLDSTVLPEGGWRQIVMRDDSIAMLRSRNEIVTGSFQHPMADRIPMDASTDNRVIAIHWESGGMIAAIRGTTQSLWYSQPYAGKWVPFYRTDGEEVSNITEAQDLNGVFYIKTRDGILLAVDYGQRAAKAIQLGQRQMHIINYAGSGNTGVTSLIDGTMLSMGDCECDASVVMLPFPVRNGMKMLESATLLYLLDATAGLFTSGNGGATWKLMPMPSTDPVNALFEIGPRQYLTTGIVLWSKLIDETDWVQVLGETDTCWSIRPGAEGVVAVTDKGIEFIKDGTSRTIVQTPESFKQLQHFGFDADGTHIAIFTGLELFVSANQGESWGIFNMGNVTPFDRVRVSKNRVFVSIPPANILMFQFTAP